MWMTSTMRAGTGVQLGDEVPGGGDHDRVEITRRNDRRLRLTATDWVHARVRARMAVVFPAPAGRSRAALVPRKCTSDGPAPPAQHPVPCRSPPSPARPDPPPCRRRLTRRGVPPRRQGGSRRRGSSSMCRGRRWPRCAARPLSGHLADLPDGRAGHPRRTSISIEGSLYLSLVEGRLVNEADRRADAIGE